MQKQNSQTGSTHLITIIILVVVLVGALGFIFWQNFMMSKSTTTQQVQIPSYVSEKAFVSDFYNQYVAAGAGLNGVDSQKLNDLTTKYRVTPSDTSGNLNGVVCGQDFPTTIKIHDGTKTAQGVTFDIEELWGESTSHVSATVGSDSKGLLITVATCSL
jgi:ABC-type Na+ efflux pump permease subunit